MKSSPRLAAHRSKCSTWFNDLSRDIIGLNNKIAKLEQRIEALESKKRRPRRSGASSREENPSGPEVGITGDKEGSDDAGASKL
jgi:hypothetical protein